MELSVYKDGKRWFIRGDPSNRIRLSHLSFVERKDADLVAMLIMSAYNRGREQLQSELRALINVNVAE